jgi:hypothetical protein
MPWVSQGVLNNPGANTILADTGTLLAVTCTFTIIVSTQYASRVTIALRDSSNTTDVSTQLIRTLSDGPTMLTGLGGILMALNQRLVIRAESTILGEVQASVLW